MTDETTIDHSDTSVTAEPPTPVVLIGDEPQPGHLTLSWRMITFATWVAVVLALASVWNASVQLGLSTWWLGPRGEPQPRIIQLSPFFVPILMLLATINRTKWLGRAGIGASLIVGLYALPDLATFSSIGALELGIAVAAGIVSAASLTGTYRRPADASAVSPD